MEPLLSMRGVDKRFAGVPALAGASLVVGRGEVHALIGQNGAGKSTLIKILTGYHGRDGGEVSFAGRPVSFASPGEAQRAGISTIYQEINLVPYRSAAENICLGRERRRWGLLDWRAMHREAAGLLARFGLDVDVRRPVMSLPTAVQQMVAIARAVAFEASLVIMDEPTSSLAEREVEVLFDVIRQLKAAGVSVVFVSHKLDELYAVCDRITVMRDGRTVHTGAMADVSRLDLVTAMLGRDLLQELQSHRAPAVDAPPILQVQGLRAGRRVRDVSLDVRPGEIVGLAGLLGAGRTETVRAVFGADPADGGTVRVNGAGAPGTPADALRAGVGFVSEDRKLDGIVPGMSVRENLTLAIMPALARRGFLGGVVDDAQSRAIADRFIARLGIRCAGPEQPIRELSGGNQQKVLLARWLCTNPRLLMLDEPTRGIDVGAKAEILGLVRELGRDGLGVLLVSSELEELVDAASRIFVLRDGRTVAELRGGDVSEPAIMEAMAQGASVDTVVA